MSLSKLAAEITAHNRDLAESATFGHLAPVPSRAYSGTVLFANSDYGPIVPILVAFEDLPNSPWFFEGLQDFLLTLVLPPGTYTTALKPGVYRFTGTYTFTPGEPGWWLDDDTYIERTADRHDFQGRTDNVTPTTTIQGERTDG